MHDPQHSRDVFEALRSVISLPDNVIRMTLTLAFDAAAVIEATYYVPLAVDVTHLGSAAHEFEERKYPVTKRYRLVEVTE